MGSDRWSTGRSRDEDNARRPTSYPIRALAWPSPSDFGLSRIDLARSIPACVSIITDNFSSLHPNGVVSAALVDARVRSALARGARRTSATTPPLRTTARRACALADLDDFSSGCRWSARRIRSDVFQAPSEQHPWSACVVELREASRGESRVPRGAPRVHRQALATSWRHLLRRGPRGAPVHASFHPVSAPPHESHEPTCERFVGRR